MVSIVSQIVVLVDIVLSNGSVNWPHVSRRKLMMGCDSLFLICSKLKEFSILNNLGPRQKLM